MIRVEKLDGSLVPFDKGRIVSAVNKSAVRTASPITNEQMAEVLNEVDKIVHLADINESILTVDDLHTTVARALAKVRYDVASEYSQFRRHKREQNKEVELFEKQMALAEASNNASSDTAEIDKHQLSDAKKAIDKIISKHPTEHVYSILHRYMGDVANNAGKDMWQFVANPRTMQILIEHITSTMLNK